MTDDNFDDIPQLFKGTRETLTLTVVTLTTEVDRPAPKNVPTTPYPGNGIYGQLLGRLTVTSVYSSIIIIMILLWLLHKILSGA